MRNSAEIRELHDMLHPLSIVESPTWPVVDQLALADETIALLADQLCWVLGHAPVEQQHDDLVARLTQ